MSTTTQKNSAKKSRNALFITVELNASNSIKVKSCASIIKRTPDFVVNSILDKTDLTPIVKYNPVKKTK
jgi:hypothetical protein